MGTTLHTTAFGLSVWLPQIAACSSTSGPEVLELPETEWVSDRIRFGTDDSPVACRGTFPYMDRFIVATSQYLQFEITEPLFYYFLTRPYRDYGINCNGPPGGCADGSRVFTDLLPHDHELVHFARGSEGSQPFFEEGTAVLFGASGYEPLSKDQPSGSVLEAIEAGRNDLAADRYALAGHFSSFLVRRYGLSRFLQLTNRVAPGMGLGEVSAVFEPIYGVSIESIDDEYVQSYPACPPEEFREFPLECQDMSLAICSDSDAPFVATFDLRCSIGAAVGVAGGSVLARKTIFVAQSGRYVVSSSIHPSRIMFAMCDPTGSCNESFREFSTIGNWGGIPDTFPIDLVEGTHVVTAYIPESNDDLEILELTIQNPCNP